MRDDQRNPQVSTKSPTAQLAAGAVHAAAVATTVRVRGAGARSRGGSRSRRGSGSRSGGRSRSRVFLHGIVMATADGADSKEGNASKKSAVEHGKLREVRAGRTDGSDRRGRVPA